MNAFYYCDNLNILPRHIRAETVQLTYLKPLFKSDYNVRFIDRNGSLSTPQIKVLSDTWGSLF